jgi:hypothetical protein
MDTGSMKVATIETVQVQATVEPTITFSIAGMPSGSNNYNTNGSTSCGNEAANSGIDSTATFVNLGLLNPGGIIHNGQKLTVTTNGSTGYVITATSSGHLINPVNGVYLSDANGPQGSNPLSGVDNPAPQTIAAGTADFGISPCGVNVSAIWYSAPNLVANGAKFSNPWNNTASAYYATIASYSSGPISGDITIVRYAAAISTTTSAGLYATAFTYVATATF